MSVALLLGVAACGHAALPRPPYTAHPSEALVEVPYPPPPARVEFVPDKPKDGAVWIDGEWSWQGTRWAWKRGRWVVPPPGVAYAPWTTVRNGDGTLYIASGTWRDPRTHAEVTGPAPVALAKASPGEIVDPEGESEKTGKSFVPREAAESRTPPPEAEPPDGGSGAGGVADAASGEGERKGGSVPP